MINPGDLVAKFQYVLDLKPAAGYIWATAGETWTAARQAALEKTTDADRASGRKYGSKWIGHRVWDCSGMFSWAFNQLGGYMYHGSNTMWDKYCTSKGELKAGKRTDGKELKPGTAVFTYNKDKKKRGHVGLYIGDGWVIEAAGTQSGVIKSRVTLSKWVEWGELKGVNYSGKPEPEPQPTPTPTPPAGKAVVTGKNVALREGPSTSTPVMVRIVTGATVDIATVSGWTYVKYGSKYGFMMNQFIKIESGSVKVTGKNVALRAGTGTNTRVLARIATGTEVPRAILPNGWTYVQAGNKKGFMMDEFIKKG